VSIFARVGYIDKYTLLNGLLIIKSLRRLEIRQQCHDTQNYEHGKTSLFDTTQLMDGL
jgi:hypothetical protein